MSLVFIFSGYFKHSKSHSYYNQINHTRQCKSRWCTSRWWRWSRLGHDRSVHSQEYGHYNFMQKIFHLLNHNFTGYTSLTVGYFGKIHALCQLTQVQNLHTFISAYRMPYLVVQSNLQWLATCIGYV